MLTPRLPHMPSWSSNPSARGAGSSSVNGTSADTLDRASSVLLAIWLLPQRRYDPDQVRRSAGCPLSPACPDSRAAVRLRRHALPGPHWPLDPVALRRERAFPAWVVPTGRVVGEVQVENDAP